MTLSLQLVVHTCLDLLDFADSVFVGEASAGSSLSNAGEWVEGADYNISDVSVEEEEVSSGEGDEGEDGDGSESSEDEWGGIEGFVDNGMDQNTPALSAELDARTSTSTSFSKFAKICH